MNLRLGRLLDAEADGRAGLDSGDRYVSGYGLKVRGIWLALSLTEQGRFDEARTELGQVPNPTRPACSPWR